MPQPKRDEKTDREKQMEHGAQSDQGGVGQKSHGGAQHKEKSQVYEGPEESQQQRRAEQTNQPRD